MFGRKDSPDPQGARVTTIVGPDTQVAGSIVSSGIVRIDGRFEGDIRTESDVVVGDGGYVKAKVLARNMSVSGEVLGNVQLSGRLEILSSGKVYGEIAVSALAIEEGGIFRGKCDMGKEGIDSGFHEGMETEASGVLQEGDSPTDDRQEKASDVGATE